MYGEYQRWYEARFMPNKTTHMACQYIVILCMEPQIPSKLFDSMDDKLSVSGMHKSRMISFITKQNIKHKGLVTHAESKNQNT